MKRNADSPRRHTAPTETPIIAPTPTTRVAPVLESELELGDAVALVAALVPVLALLLVLSVEVVATTDAVLLVPPAEDEDEAGGADVAEDSGADNNSINMMH